MLLVIWGILEFPALAWKVWTLLRLHKESVVISKLNKRFVLMQLVSRILEKSEAVVTL